ncbi:MAG: hypothetical protein HUJ63_12135, partial [Enterococcus sp.]|nr:hypothetical protein [Enterococcus sp.]
DELSEDLRVLACLLIFYEELNEIDELYDFEEGILNTLTTEMYRFFNCGDDKTQGKLVSTPLFDWQNDEQIICSAINNVANKEIRLESYIHWWTFLGYYYAIGESVFSTVVSIRDKIVHGKKLEKWEREYQEKNPEQFIWRKEDKKAQELEKQLKELW